MSARRPSCALSPSSDVLATRISRGVCAKNWKLSSRRRSPSRRPRPSHAALCAQLSIRSSKPPSTTCSDLPKPSGAGLSGDRGTALRSAARHLSARRPLHGRACALFRGASRPRPARRPARALRDRRLAGSVARHKPARRADRLRHPALSGRRDHVRAQRNQPWRGDRARHRPVAFAPVASGGLRSALPGRGALTLGLRASPCWRSSKP